MMNESRRITKIKMNGVSVQIQWEELAMDQSWAKFGMKNTDMARPEMFTAMNALATDVIDLCELPTIWKKQIEVRGVSITYTEKTWGITISAIKRLDKSKKSLVLNTPYTSVDGCDNMELLLSANAIEHIERLTDEAQRYIDGDRAQMKLFDGKQGA